MRHSFAYLAVAVAILAIGALAALGLRIRRRRNAHSCVWCGAAQGETHASYCRTEGRG
jgi:hypothetical protein